MVLHCQQTGRECQAEGDGGGEMGRPALQPGAQPSPANEQDGGEDDEAEDAAGKGEKAGKIRVPANG